MQNYINKHMAVLVDLEKILSLTTMHIYWLDSSNTYQGCNDLQAKSAGLASRFDVVGKKNCEIPWGKNNPEIAERWDKVNLEVLSTGEPKFIEEDAVFQDGRKAIFLSHKLPLKDDQGKVVGLLGLSIDITNQKTQQDKWKNEKERVELTLEHIIANLPNHVYWKNEDGVYLGSNNLQAQSLGLSSWREIIGKTDFDLPGGTEGALKFRENDIKVMQTGKMLVAEEPTLVNGKPAIVLSQKMPLKNMSGKIMGVIGISTDITERKKTEQALTLAKEKAEFANQAKMEFLQNMRHDFRTPFCGILGMANILYDDETDSIKKDRLLDIVNASQVLLDQLSAITSFISIEDKELAILAKQFDLYRVIEDIEKMLLPATKEKQIEFTIDIEKDVPQYIIGDELRTQRILLNLLANAVKFTSIGHVTFTASIAKVENKNLIIKFKIEDTGIGIPEEEQNAIFEKFYRVNPSYEGKYPGNGLGLRIVKQFVDELGGEVHVHSKFGKGSTFIVLIPCKLPLLECDIKEL